MYATLYSFNFKIRSLLTIATGCWHPSILWCVKINEDKAHGNYDKYVDYSNDRDLDFRRILNPGLIVEMLGIAGYELT